MNPMPALLVAAGLAVSACTGLPPTPDEMAAVPVVRYGQPAPTDRPFVLHYPAGQPLPVKTAVSGSLLEHEGKADLQVSLRRDVYVYKHWASFDGKNWKLGHDLVSGQIGITLPGEADGRSPGSLTAEFDPK